MNTTHNPPDRHARTILPGVVHDRLRHLALDLNTSLSDLLVDGAILLLKFHGRGESLPEPLPPFASSNANGRAV